MGVIEKIQKLSEKEFEISIDDLCEEYIIEIMTDINHVTDSRECSGCGYKFQNDESSWCYCTGCGEPLTQGEYYPNDFFEEGAELLEDELRELYKRIP